ncbi:MAG: radical SAM protein [Candidatus Verstraetearchaeota archaeon]|nr:radical SAM protein [Candidatus Verstraetearchaeota archaeon]
MGCNLACIHCQNWSISQQLDGGVPLSEMEVARLIDRARRRGCRNQNWVGGDPIPHIPFWLRVLLHEEENTPVFFNTNGYYSLEASALLKGVVDLYKIDFKYGSDRCAERISGVGNYWKVLTRNLKSSKSGGELLIRILVLPGHLECCLGPMLSFIARELGTDTRVNLMDQYAPHWRAAECPELRRRLSREEWERALKMVSDSGLENVIS